MQDKFEYVLTCIAKCKLDKDLSFHQRFNALYRTIMEIDDFQNDSKMNVMDRTIFAQIKTQE